MALEHSREPHENGYPHSVPLSDRAFDIIKQVERSRQGDVVFLGSKPGKALSDVILMVVLRRMRRGEVVMHGFRSCGIGTAVLSLSPPGLHHVGKEETRRLARGSANAWSG
jgi:hypothetical protein